MKENEPTNTFLDEGQWRALRIFLSSLNDRDFATARRQLNREVAARRERETNALRLFYSSLTNEDLQRIQQEIDFLSSPFPKNVIF